MDGTGDHDATSEVSNENYLLPIEMEMSEESLRFPDIDLLIPDVSDTGPCDTYGNYLEVIDENDVQGVPEQNGGWNSEGSHVGSYEPHSAIAPSITISDLPASQANDMNTFPSSASHSAQWDILSQRSANGFHDPQSAAHCGNAFHNGEQHNGASFNGLVRDEWDEGVESETYHANPQHPAGDIQSIYPYSLQRGVPGYNRHQPPRVTGWPTRLSDAPWDPYTLHRPQPNTLTQFYDAYCNSSSRVHTQNGYSSASNMARTGTSATSYDPNLHDMADPREQALMSPHEQTLPVPENPSFMSAASSPGQSTISVTASDEPSVLHCQYGCGADFQGKYRRGTLQRHIRLKHGKKPQYLCVPCGKVYLRQDARLKHQRRQHPELQLAGPVSRNRSTSHG